MANGGMMGEDSGIPGAAPGGPSPSDSSAATNPLSIVPIDYRPLVGHLDLHGLAEQVLVTENQLADSHDPLERLVLLTTLAWYQRQRDTNAAMAMVDEAMDLLHHASCAQERELRRLTARLLLTKAECRLLLGDLAGAEAMLAGAQESFREIDDPLGAGDACMVEALLAFDQGQSRRRISAHRRGWEHYQHSGDRMRQRIARTWMARDALSEDAEAAAEQWLAELPVVPGLEHPGLDAVVAYCHGGLEFARGNFLTAQRHYQRGCDLALLAGRIRLAVMLAANAAGAFSNLNDYVAEFVWRERAHQLARGTGWPAALGQCLRGLGDTLRRLGQTGRARQLLTEALDCLTPLGRSRNYAICCQHLGDLDMEVGEPALALGWFESMGDIAAELEQADLQTEAATGRSRALSALGRREEAAAAMAEATALLAGCANRWREIELLMAQAELHRRFPDLPPPVPDLAPHHTTAIHLLSRALALAESIQGYTVPANLLSALAAAYEAAGDLGQALAFERRACQARGLLRSREVSDRLLAMQASFETERLKAEGEYHRHLAAAEAARAAALHEATQTLELLGRIGQQITAKLDADAVFHALHRHAGTLLAFDSFALYLMDDGGEHLELRYGLELGRPLPTIWRSLSDPVSVVARCARDRQELLIQRSAHETDAPSHIPGTRFMRTLLLAPLLAGSRLIGVMTVQSTQENAYGERERLIFRSLSAYGAIALSNAAAYARVDSTLSELRLTQNRLVQQEKHASLGQLVAGVAHEINTPLGVAFTLATHLEEEREQVADTFQAGALTRVSMNQFLEKLQEGLRIMTGNLQRAAELVRSFKQVSADRSSEATRTLDLAAYLADVVRSLDPMLRESRVKVAIDAQPGLMLTTMPGLLSQVVTNLVQNAVVHGFAGVEAPQILIAAGRAGMDRLAIAITDNGIGMSAEVQAKAFDPFFTTRRDSGGTGLGLHIVHNLVTGALGGDIDLASIPGHGTRFLIHLPINPPLSVGEMS
ncbi:GAF domain-containing protein [Niveispirillum sp. SYP-B3756]|uniref:GAF domain-containing sensor histidine kinase n=1 Tax=Niveispirillum sp. SYP-B3756 TaxID=2662178 RepID=UPI001291EAAC|nr:GAF domain-containing sensor histidine kinase [Niveispirillum sp. SYP-B3756]MQP64423.1 GAF domain-containing protein [Niveispirillum sp. SYP-B3756]